MNNFLPITKRECDELGWGAPDFVYVSGDAYVDHPSFGTAIITRVLENAGFRVAVLAQPDYKSCEDFKRFGKPYLVLCKIGAAGSRTVISILKKTAIHTIMHSIKRKEGE
jgi:hypothetical protein